MIEVLHYERANKNKTIGYVDIKLPKVGIIIRKIAHLQDGDKKWFNLPSLMRDRPDGSKDYPYYFEFTTNLHNSQLLDLLHDPVKQYCMKHKIAEIVPLDLNVDISGDLPF